MKLDSVPPLSTALKSQANQRETLILDCYPENLEMLDDKEFLRSLVINSKALKKLFEDDKDRRITLEKKGIHIFDSLESIDWPMFGNGLDVVS